MLIQTRCLFSLASIAIAVALPIGPSEQQPVGFRDTTKFTATADKFESVKIQQGSKAFTYQESGERFMARGVTYQPAENADPITDTDCTDFKSEVLPKLLHLNINVLRTYQLDPMASHKCVMDVLKENNIYLLAGTMDYATGIDALQGAYTTAYKRRVELFIDEFGQYDNTLALIIGNEVLAWTGIEKNAQASIAIKSAIRDAKAYIASKGIRQIPIGGGMRDAPNIDPTRKTGVTGTAEFARFLACKTDNVHADFVAIDAYRYVGPGGASGAWDSLVPIDSGYGLTEFSVPALLSEFGAFHPGQDRPWDDVSGQLWDPSHAVSQQVSGGIAFHFLQDEMHWGLYTRKSGRNAMCKPTDPCRGGDLLPGDVAPAPGGAENLAAQFARVKDAVPTVATAPSSWMACPAGNLKDAALVQAS